eukprot:m.24071 g.24071  ORF g.24071 m.24071 type:complete len:1374 (-) comp8560_c0_seq1:2404-6525(-)
MCRFTAYVGPPIAPADLVTRPTRSIIAQSYEARERITERGYLNGDGFGLGWYPLPVAGVPSTGQETIKPCIFKSTGPAWNSTNLRNIAESIMSNIVFAHVRAATPGTSVEQSSCHPFQFGRFMMMHNGAVGGFNQIRRFLLARIKQHDVYSFALDRGGSDSALCFALFLDQLDRFDTPLSPAEMATKLQRVIDVVVEVCEQHDIEELSMLNFVLTDGETTCCTRFVRDPTQTLGAATLYFASGQEYKSVPGKPGHYRMAHRDRRHSVALIASEPLTNSTSDWVPVPTNHILVVANNRIMMAPHFLKLPATITLPTALNFLDSYNAMQVTSPPFEHSTQAHILSSSDAILCTMVKRNILITGSQAGDIRLWDYANLKELDSVRAHAGSVLTLTSIQGADDVCANASGSTKPLIIFSGSSDCTLKSWGLCESNTLTLLRVVSFLGLGDVLSLATLDAHIGIGFQDGKVRVLPISALMKDTNVHPARQVSDFSLAVLHRYAGDDDSIGDGDAVVGSVEYPAEDSYQHRGLHRSLSCVDFSIPSSPTRESPSRRMFSDSVAFSSSDLMPRKSCAPALPKPEPQLPSTTPSPSTAPDAAAAIALVTGAINPMLAQELSTPSPLVSSAVQPNQQPTAPSRAQSASPLQDLHAAPHERLLSTEPGERMPVATIARIPHTTCPETSDPALNPTTPQPVGHFSYVFALCSYEGRYLISGGADGIIKVWTEQGECKATFLEHRDSVQALTVYGNTLCSGSCDQTVRTWDLEQLCTRNVSVRLNAPVLALAYGDERVLCGLDNGAMVILDAYNLEPLLQLGSDYDDAIQTVAFAGNYIIGGTATHLLVWTCDIACLPAFDSATSEHQPTDDDVAAAAVESSQSRESVSSTSDTITASATSAIGTARTSLQFDEGLFDLPKGAVPYFIRQLELFVSFPSVPGVPRLAARCYDAAKFLQSVFERHGCVSRLFDTIPDRNPLVLAKMWVSDSCPTVLVYGHYDVVPVVESSWATNPWQLKSRDGYLYGRGTSDDKGPLLAMIFAAHQLQKSKRLNVNMLFIVEGEGENKSLGFSQSFDTLMSTPELKEQWLPSVDYLLISNNYWIGEDRPCITYSMRGLISLEVNISGAQINLHSGMDGGAIREPLQDLVAVLASLTDRSMAATIPGFYDNVRPLSDAEREANRSTMFDVGEYKQLHGVSKLTSEDPNTVLGARWNMPTLTVCDIKTSNVESAQSIIPSSASAKISIRFVPDQDGAALTEAVERHIKYEFRKRDSGNKLNVKIEQVSTWWHDDHSAPYYKAAADAIRSVWQVDPLFVREGGTVNTTPMLTQRLGVPALHLPLGQSSDSAHLPNERIRMQNLTNGQLVVELFLVNLGKLHSPTTETSK